MLRPARKNRPKPDVKTPYFALDGGLNLVDSPLDIKPGVVVGALNYELAVRGGYRRIAGHERFDGQASPSEAVYWLLNFVNATAAISAGDVVDGASASGTALLDAVITSGSYGGGDAAGYLILATVTGTFVDGEDLDVSAVKKSEADGTAVESGADNDTDNNTYTRAAIEAQRALIGKVGASDGSGPIRGAHIYKGVKYAFRDNTAGTECLMWKATAAGWVQQSLGNRVAFTMGSAEFIEGETLSQGGATATINRVVKQSGDWGSSDAAGYLIIGAVTGGPYSAGAATSASGVAVLSGAEAANTIAPGGMYEFKNGNFFGSSVTERMYGVSGVDYAFEWDGSVYVPIITGNTVDTPSHIEINEYHLMLVFQNGSLQNSATGTPYVWAGGGAAEIGIGSDIVGLKKEVGGPMAVLCRSATHLIYGKNTTDSPWDKVTIADDAGGIEWTMQRIGATRYFDDRGITSLDAVQEYGNFKDNVISQWIEPLIEDNKTKVTTSVVSKSKNQYRVYFNDGTAIYATFDNKKIKGFMPQSFFDGSGNPLIVRCATSGEGADGSEEIFFGSDDGYLYQMDKGTSFDGYKVEAFIVLSYLHLKSPEIIKEWLRMVLQVQATTAVTLYMTPDFDYSEREDVQQVIETLSGGGRWNVANWNEFLWSAPGVGSPAADIDGSGTNLGVVIYTEDTYAAPHTIKGMTLHYMFRRRARGG